MDAKFMAEAEQEAEEERAAHATVDAEQQCHREAAAAEEESDDDDFDWSGPGPKEKAVEHRALVEYFETLKKENDADNKALQQRLLEDAEAHRALATARRMERRAAEKLMRRDGGNDGAGPSTVPRGDE
jgi:hypothetical protein